MSIEATISIDVRFPYGEIDSESMQKAGEHGIHKMIELYEQDGDIDIQKMTIDYSPP